MMSKGIKTVIVIVCCAAVFIIVKSALKQPIQKKSIFIMDTLCTVQIPGGREVLPVIDKALARMAEVDRKFNMLDPGSPLYDFNKRGMPVTDPEILKVTAVAIETGKKSGEALDITIAPVIREWGFYTGETMHLPSDSRIRDAVKKTGLKYLEIKDGRLIKKQPWIEVDLGAVAKGYAVDEAGRIIRENGIKSALVDGGGDILAIGKVRGKPWRVGIKNPRGRGVAGVIDAQDVTIVTSGDYERYFIKDGVRYCHIMDPKTGRPARGISGVTIITKNSLYADSWSTAMFVLGLKKGLETAKGLPDTECIFITEDGKKYMTPGLAAGTTVRKI